ncbi:MAG TPA: efflux RND transporter periplasmic adaptor subunit [Candidatus Binatia bacterium]|nr:efflux RND transporter periplasmic adaptor subunit [Candidatus Binatia bacterium]
MDQEPIHGQGQAATPGGRSRAALWVGGILLLAAIVVAAGILPRLKARAALRTETREMATPVVSVVHPERGKAVQELILPATLQPWTDAPIYARTNGYLKRWYFDIGARVRSGQLLADIDTPEVDQQLGQARADLVTAQANEKLASITAARYQDLLKTESVSKQDVDNAEGDYAAKRAIVQSAQANVRRLEELQSFEKIYAPFDGVVTARNVDVGSLIDAGSSGGMSPARELFHMAAIWKMRVYVNVPQPSSQAAQPGMTADLALPEYPGRRFTCRLINTANAIDPSTRTLLAQFEAANPTGELLPGAYAELHMKLSSEHPTFLLPVNTLLFRSEGLRVVAVDSGNKARLIPITLGRDFGNQVEVVTGLEGTELVIQDPPDSVVDGEAVRLAAPSAPQKKP